MSYAELREEIDEEIDAMLSDYEEQCHYSLRGDIVLAEQLRDEAEALFAAELTSVAERRLECLLRPKWWSLEACEEAYWEVMGR